jgi:hypothetical protein
MKFWSSDTKWTSENVPELIADMRQIVNGTTYYGQQVHPTYQDLHRSADALEALLKENAKLKRG